MPSEFPIWWYLPEERKGVCAAIKKQVCGACHVKIDFSHGTHFQGSPTWSPTVYILAIAALHINPITSLKNRLNLVLSVDRLYRSAFLVGSKETMHRRYERVETKHFVWNLCNLSSWWGWICIDVIAPGLAIFIYFQSNFHSALHACFNLTWQHSRLSYEIKLLAGKEPQERSYLYAQKTATRRTYVRCKPPGN